MSITTLTTFIEVTNKKGDVELRLQNGKEGTIKYDGQNYKYLSFIYQGSAINLNGDNLESTLVMSSNWLAKGFGQDAVMETWRVQVNTCSMKASDMTVAKTLTTEYWIVASMGYDDTTVELLLSSGIDAVGANAPSKTLTTDMVGQLPVTANIRNS